MMAAVTTTSYARPDGMLRLGDLPEAMRRLTDRSFWTRRLATARTRVRLWRLERELKRTVDVLDRLSDRQLALLGLDRSTMPDVLEDRMIARETGDGDFRPEG